MSLALAEEEEEGQNRDKENDIIDDDVQQFLAQSGLDPSVMDEASLEALKGFLGSSNSSGHSPATATAATSNTKNDNASNNANDSTKKNGKIDNNVSSTLNNSNNNNSNGLLLQRQKLLQQNSLTAEDLAKATAVEKQILTQLELQLKLLMDMHRQLEALAEKVEHLQHITVATAGGTTITHQRIPFQQQQQQQQQRHVIVVGAPPPLAPRGNNTLWQSLWSIMVVIPNMLYESRISKIIRLFIRMQHQQVRDNFDGGLVLKVLVIVAVLTARWSSNKRKQQQQQQMNNNANNNATPSFTQFWHAYRFYITIMLVGFGLLIQSGYIEFLYNFFIKENYPVRIWFGEDVAGLDDNNNNRQRVPPPPQRAQPQVPPQQAQQPQQPLQQQQQLQPQQQPPAAAAAVAGQAREPAAAAVAAAAAANRFPNWNQINDGLLRLMLPPPPPPDAAAAAAAAAQEQQQVEDGLLVKLGRMLVRALLDLICLIGSFVLSIFPMVNLEALRIPAPAVPPAAAAAPLDDENNNGGAVPPPQNPAAAAAAARQEQNHPGPGQVQPPRDPAEPLEDE